MLASGRRNKNTIWSLEDAKDRCYENEADLKDLDKAHLASIYKDDGGTCIFQQLKVVLLYPRMIPIQIISNLTCPITLEEIEFSLKYFKKDWSPGPDGWPVEF